MKLVQGAFLVLLTAALSFLALLTSSTLKWAGELPSLEGLDALEFTSTSIVYAADGVTRIGMLVPAEGESRVSTNRIPVSLDEVSPAALQAIVAYEDDQFYNHYGLDLPAFMRATYEEFFGAAQRGGSTITTQVIKNTLLQEIRSERSLERKAKEIMLAIELERRHTKSEVLQRYINVVFWGGNVYGIRAAAQAYFGKDPIELNLAEGLYLSRLIPAPNARHEDFSGTRASMREVIDKMVRLGTISSEMAERTWRYPLEPLGWEVSYGADGSLLSAVRTDADVLVQGSVSSDLSRAVVIAVRNWLTDRYGDGVVFGSGGLRVITTIDVQAQLAANEASLTAEVPEGAQMAIVGIDPATGAVLAMVGQKLEEGVRPGELNRATQAYRQPGSSFKPIVYATAIEQGGFNQATILVDGPATFEVRGQEPYQPDNWDFSYDGFQTVRANVNRSRNIPAVKALEAATPEAVAEKARELGYDVEPYYAMALGSFEVTPLQHTAAMAAFANGGVYIEPYFIQRVEDAEGNVMYEASPHSARVWSEQTAYIMLDLLHGNVVDREPAYGLSNRAVVPGRRVAGKTGTTNDERDIWFVGLTPGMVASVWIGNDDSSSMPASMTLSNGNTDSVTSSRQPIYAWNDFVENALRGRSSGGEGFPVPDGIVFHRIDLKTGAVDPNGVMAAFRESADLNAQQFMPALRISLPIDTATGLRATVDTPADRIKIIEVTPDEAAQYLPEGAG
ncbi:MAG TPA: transglycosylase domain-containing protein [Trueperaceae bacterium]|nr:transglycosylase domain-containing protein [Trueperaceae bacterium]